MSLCACVCARVYAGELIERLGPFVMAFQQSLDEARVRDAPSNWLNNANPIGQMNSNSKMESVGGRGGEGGGGKGCEVQLTAISARTLNAALAQAAESGLKAVESNTTFVLVIPINKRAISLAVSALRYGTRVKRDVHT